MVPTETIELAECLITDCLTSYAFSKERLATRAVNGGVRRCEKAIKMLRQCSAALARRTPRFQKKAEHCLNE